MKPKPSNHLRQRPDADRGKPRGRSTSAASWFSRRHDWLLAAGLAAVVLVAYQPAWHGGLIWDDDCHVTRPELRSWEGLGRIWCDLKATQQYYPLLHSAFWLEWQLWGDNTLGYHLVNILLHVTAAILLAVILRRLAVPGAYLAAAIFALHPVQVESVAWITELKNTLSTVFYLSAAIVYLRFDESRKKTSYAAAIGLFALALLSKTVTATLPAALLVVFWWQRGRLSWRRDVRPLLPFLVLGVAAGLFTAWVEHSVGGAQGEEYSFTIVERFLIAGRAVWFYLGKLFWPANLTFIYPRWHVSQAQAWQYLFPLAAVGLILALWGVRRRWRGPLAAMLFFLGTLFPAIGFFNVYPFRYSFVADHFQYLASIGIIALTAAAAATLMVRRELWGRPSGYFLCGALLFALAVRTWSQCLMYDNLQLLYETTIERNPDCWMAYKNLGKLFCDSGDFNRAEDCYRNTIRMHPKDDEGHLNLGTAFKRQGRIDQAIEEYRAALAIKDSAEAHLYLANALAVKGELRKSAVEYQAALAIRPDYAEAHCNFGVALLRCGKTAEAAAEYQKALDANSKYAGAHYNLADALLLLGRYDEAIAEYRKAIDIQPDYVVAKQKLEAVLSHLDQIKAERAKPKPEAGGASVPSP